MRPPYFPASRQALADVLEREAATAGGNELERVRHEVEALRASIELEWRVGS